MLLIESKKGNNVFVNKDTMLQASLKTVVNVPSNVKLVKVKKNVLLVQMEV